ncbi:GNAT family N-acetyltransferase [Methanosarcina sp. DH2]|nr:GNAT family N-acetyltransferase [Methanosarcina sp. DH2]
MGYLAIEENKCAGTVHSSHPQRTTAWKLCISLFSEFEGRGVATRTAQALVQIAFEAVPEMTIAAQPFPEENTSNNVPSKLGFQFFAELEHPTEVRLALREIFISSRFFGPSLYNRRIFFLFSENKTRSR